MWQCRIPWLSLKTIRVNYRKILFNFFDLVLKAGILEDTISNWYVRIICIAYRLSTGWLNIARRGGNSWFGAKTFLSFSQKLYDRWYRSKISVFRLTAILCFSTKYLFLNKRLRNLSEIRVKCCCWYSLINRKSWLFYVPKFQNGGRFNFFILNKSVNFSFIKFLLINLIECWTFYCHVVFKYYNTPKINSGKQPKYKLFIVSLLRKMYPDLDSY